MSGAHFSLLAITIVVGSGVLWFRRMYQVRIPHNRTLFVAVWLSGAGLGLVALLLGTGWIGGAAAISAIGLASFFLFIVSISHQIVGEEAFRVGDRVPDLIAFDENGEAFALSTLLGRPVLLKFFRGHW